MFMQTQMNFGKMSKKLVTMVSLQKRGLELEMRGVLTLNTPLHSSTCSNIHALLLYFKHILKFETISGI